MVDPVKVFDGLVSYFDTSSCIFSPDQDLIVPSTSAKKGANGQLVFIDRTTLQVKRTVDVVPNGSAVATLWNPVINQIVVGGSDGARVLYSPGLSTKGALSCAGRKARVTNALESALGATIYNPHALPLYQRQAGGKRKRESARHTIETKKPPMPTTELHSSSIYHSFMMKGLSTKDNRTQDPREVFLAKGEASNTTGAVDNPWFKKGEKNYVDHVYAKNQPKAIFAKEEEEQED